MPKNPVREGAKKSPLPDHLTIPFRGVDYTITRELVDDVEIFELLEDGKSLTALRRMLGADQWAAFKEANRKDGRVSLTVMNDFLNDTMDVIGEARGGNS